ncbi:MULTISPECIES: DUF6978 family protein [Leuconostoc]|uniref:Uncharacterized protein n=1 Tax=Leuconostoc inhae TaxID=178001 RepID=A0AAN2UGA2_9LACO|nr:MULTISPECIES: polymorphic toxin type 24 domain-containing protein [Leuconostoc]MBZ5954891.1 hypothetical protein [Leuconostoc gasicomitatum]MBZ5957591.1 hypothetical protein [Leuconostoc gasicomitatum]MBZ5966889.1 hypothetical protein [Leuconostoc gasicomitatum]MBZ5980109.1 hypothetical protein [Leuconostoc gasicomitatum]MBZ5981798.1 hypothetical protein [Leuconostoc gasicomitatum]
MSNQQLFTQLKQLAKLVEGNSVTVPAFSKESRTLLKDKATRNSKFDLIINKKGHRNKDIFSLVIMSSNYPDKIMMRLDYSGSSHKGVETPHVHIFDEQHDFGSKAISLQNLSSIMINQYMDALTWFLKENSVDMSGVQIQETIV